MRCLLALLLLSACASGDWLAEGLAQHPDLDLPAADEVPVAGLARVPLVVASEQGVFVDGAMVVGVRDGQIDPAFRRGTLVAPLFDRMKDIADAAKDEARRGGAAFDGRVVLAWDLDLPVEVPRQVMYTLGQAQFAEFLVVSETPTGVGAVARPLPAIGGPRTR